MSREERITVAEYPVALSLTCKIRLLSKFPDKQEVYLDVIVERPKKLIERNLLVLQLVHLDIATSSACLRAGVMILARLQRNIMSVRV